MNLRPLADPERDYTSPQSGGSQQLPGCAGAPQREGKRERKNSLGVVRPVALRATKVSKRRGRQCIASPGKHTQTHALNLLVRITLVWVAAVISVGVHPGVFSMTLSIDYHWGYLTCTMHGEWKLAS